MIQSLADIFQLAKNLIAGVSRFHGTSALAAAGAIREPRRCAAAGADIRILQPKPLARPHPLV
jgi:hypothetical protein